MPLFEPAGGGASIETSSNPVALGTASPGSGSTASAYDHIHPTTGMALISGGNTFSGAQVFGGSTQIASDGKIGVGAASDATSMVKFGTHSGTAVTLYGIRGFVTFPSTTTTTGTVFYAQISTSATSFTMSNGYPVFVDSPIVGAGSAITNGHGIQIANQGGSGISNARGLNVAAQSGSTLNICAAFGGGTQTNIHLNSDTASQAGGIAFGTSRDLQLFRSSSTTLALTVTSGTAAMTIGGSAVLTAASYATKGQILIATGSGTFTALGVGTNTQVLTADSTQSSGVKWADATGGGGESTSFATDSRWTVGA